ncbi:hypothetical protein WJX84_008193 [Apatococcus fuscideae]|uniref:Uncharacterized protein n=1 Tax=Apatococcus fuscideae TaxID=2026836 RepID=A0AAW1T7V0_9CHLO
MALTARRRFIHEKSSSDRSGELLGDVSCDLVQLGSHLRDRAGAQLWHCREHLNQQQARRSCRVDCFGSASLANGVSARPEATAGAPEAQRKAPLVTLASSGSDSPAQPQPNVPGWRISLGNLAAGATAGCAVEAALYPLDTIKTRMQAVASGGGMGELFKGGGLRALYSGLWGNLVGVAPASAIFLCVYEPLKRAVCQNIPEDRQFLGPIVAGASAGLAASIVRVPTEVVKQRMQTGEFSRALVALKTIIQTEGPMGLFAGYRSFLLRDLPFDAIEFFAYEQLKITYSQSLKDRRPLNPAETSFIGAGAGMVTAIFTTPLDVLKTRLMTQGAKKTYSGPLDCLARILKEEGAPALFKGWQPRVVWIGIGGCIFFSALEEAKKLFVPQATTAQPEK